MESYVDEINQFFWSLTIFVLFVCAFIYLSRSFKKKEIDERLLMLGFASVSFGLSFSQFFFYLGEILIQLHDFYDLIAILSFTIGMTIFFYIFDKLLKKTKYIPVFINLIIIILIIILMIVPSYEYQKLLEYTCYLFNAPTFCFILIWFSKKSSDESKIVSILLLTGEILYIIGTILSSNFILDVISITPLISYFFFVSGAILFISPGFIKSKEKSSVKIALILVSTIYIISLFIVLIIVINFFLLYNVNYIIIATICSVIFGTAIVIIHFLYGAIKLTSSSERIDVEQELEQRKDIFSIFSKPELITEEEVSISKEKRTCLVCKKDLSRDIYICPNCYAFYCKSCSGALSNIENACWVCNTPLDPSKPVKLLEQTIKDEDKKGKLKKIAIVTIIDLDFYDKVERFKWDEEEKKEFLKSMLSLSTLERNTILNEMIEMAESLNKGEGYFEEDFS